MTFTGTATLSNKDTGYDIIQAVNSYATATINVVDKNFTNISTLNANQLKSIIKTSQYARAIFRGEITKMTTLFEQVQYTAIDKARKLVNQRADYNPIKLAAYVRQPFRDTSAANEGIKDDDIDFTQYAAVNDMIHYQRSNKQQMVIGPNDIYALPSEYLFKYIDGPTDFSKDEDSPAAASTSITEAGDINKMYKEKSGYSYYADAANTEDTFLRLDCYFSLRSGVSVSKIASLDISVSTRKLSVFSLLNSSTDDPFIGIYNWTLGYYEGNYLRSQDVGGSRFNETPTPVSSLSETPLAVVTFKEDRIGRFSTPSQAIETISTTGDTTLYRIRLMVGAGQSAGFAVPRRKLIRLDSIQLTLELDGINEVEVGASQITAVADGSLTVSDATYGRVAVEDNIGKGDRYIITDTLDDQISALATQWGITINANITNSSILALTSDYTVLTKQQVFQDICALCNGMWWYDPDADSYEIVSADNLSSSGITITKNDIENYLTAGAWSYKVDSTNLRDELVIQGSEGFGVATQTLSPEFTHALGAEQVILKRPAIQSYYQLTKLVAAERHKYENARRKAQFTLDLDTPNQDYTNLVLGTKIAFQLPDASSPTVANHTVAGSNELVVTDLQFSRKAGTNHRRKVTVTAQERFS